MKTISTRNSRGVLTMFLMVFSISCLVAQTPYVHYTFDVDGTDAQGNANINLADAAIVPDATRGTNVASIGLSDVAPNAAGGWFLASNTEMSVTMWASASSIQDFAAFFFLWSNRS